MLVASVTLIRIVVAATLGLTDTEAYYASWTRVLDWSYYDHPPLLAWLTSVTMHFSSSPLGIRLVPIACSAIFALLLHRFVTRTFSARAGFFAVAVTLCLPAFIFIGFVSNPEAPLAPLWILALSMTWDLRDRDEPWRPIALGAVIGAAFLAKYTAILMMPVALVWIASAEITRRWLRRPSLWAGALVALVVASPVVIWNVQHGWPSLTLHLSERMAAPSLATYAENAVRTASGQIALFQPLALLGLATMLVIAVRRWRDDRFRLLAIAGAPVLIFFFLMMTRVRDAEPHWTMVGWMPAAIASGAWLDEVRWSRALVWYARLTVAVTVSMASISVLHATTPAMIVLAGDRYEMKSDPMNETIGWDKVRAAVETRMADLGPNAVVASSHNVFCGRLEIELGDRNRVFCPSPRRTEFDFTNRRNPPAGAPILFIESVRYPADPSALLPDRTCAPLEDLEVMRAGHLVNRYRFHACR
jgi:4-amino-4-deoxy-L-arabinose transferase-like glycosyltransferase